MPLELTRRKFFFFGLAAGVGLMLPDMKIELEKEELQWFKVSHNFGYFNPDGGNLGRGSTVYELRGIPYHENNASIGTWLGFDRSGK